MSLVNQMLRDLNARRAGEIQATVHADVRPLPERSNPRRNLIRIVGGGVLALAVVGLAVSGWLHRTATHHEEAPSAAQQIESPMVTAEAVTQVTAPAPAPDAERSSSVRSSEATENVIERSTEASVPPASHVPSRSAMAQVMPSENTVSAPDRKRIEKEKTTIAAKPIEPSRNENGKPEKHHPSSGLRVDETLELTLAPSRGSGRMTSAPVSVAEEKTRGREGNHGVSNASTISSSTNASSPPNLMAEERIVLTRKDKYGQDEKPEKIERSEGNSSQAAIEKLDRSEHGDEGYREGVAAYQQGRLKDAVMQLQSVLRENPKHLQARQALLGIYMEYKRYDDAIILLRMGLDQMPGQATWAMTMARIQVERNNQAEALATLEKYQVAGERNADYQGFMAVLLQNQRRSHDASLRYKAALRLKPREGRWWFALGEALEADKRAAEATEAYRQAQSLGGLTPAMNDVLLTKLR